MPMWLWPSVNTLISQDYEMDRHTDVRPAQRRVADAGEQIDCFAVVGWSAESVADECHAADSCEPNEVLQVAAVIVYREEGEGQDSEDRFEQSDLRVRSSEGHFREEVELVVNAQANNSH